ncbi:hypothetical protein AOLI_G00203970 [Acnodon oligacanthus]
MGGSPREETVTTSPLLFPVSRRCSRIYPHLLWCEFHHVTLLRERWRKKLMETDGTEGAGLMEPHLPFVEKTGHCPALEVRGN